ncbi:hypothetical protein GEV33_014446 [Tenebrio molitor]|uniref:Uncharacterized protein n=1 Tax=Tenebrio molitor TaxID=7067 RepID=A0A8J6GY99_TENMO|nr:hypothetical protein GEV33_014446 [Tenebrio molitor]
MLNLFSFQQQVFSADLRRTRLKTYLMSEKKNESHPTSKIVYLTRPPSDLAPYVYSFNDPFLLYFLHKAQMFSPGHACYPRKDETFLLCVTDTSTFRRGCGRRWTSLKQHPRSCTEPLTEIGNGSGVSTPSTTNTSPLPATAGEGARKSNWQVIEHFSSKDKGSLSSSLIAHEPQTSSLFSEQQLKSSLIPKPEKGYKNEFTCMHVGSVSRTPPAKENGSAPNSSPELEGHEVEAELLVSSVPKQSAGFFGKLLRLIKKLFRLGMTPVQPILTSCSEFKWMGELKELLFKF